MLSKFIFIGLVFLQITDGAEFLLSKLDNLSVMVLLGILVYILHRQERTAQEQIRVINELRLKELRDQLASQEQEIQFLRKQIEELKRT